MNISTLSYINIFKNIGTKQDFKGLDKSQKVSVMATAIFIGMFTFAVGGLVYFRYKTHKLATRALHLHIDQYGTAERKVSNSAQKLLSHPQNSTKALSSDNYEKYRAESYRHGDLSQSSLNSEENFTGSWISQSENNTQSTRFEELVDSEIEELEEPPEDKFINDIMIKGKNLPIFPSGIKGTSIQFLSQFVTLGQANDDGDCFYDSIAQLLSIEYNKKVTIKDVREILKEYVDALETTNSESWVKDACGGVDEYIHYKENIAKGMEDNLNDKNITQEELSIYKQSIKRQSELVDEILKCALEINSLQEKRSESDGEQFDELLDNLEVQVKTYTDLQQEYKKTQKDLSEILNKYEVEPPDWGSTVVDCRLLYELFGIDIVTHTAYLHEVNKNEVESEEKAIEQAQSFIHAQQENDVSTIQILAPTEEYFRCMVYFTTSSKDIEIDKNKIDTNPFLEKRGLTKLHDKQLHIAFYCNHFVPCIPKE